MRTCVLRALLIFSCLLLLAADSPQSLEKQCRRGSGEACYRSAQWQNEHRDRVKAAEFYAASCDAGYPRGCFDAGYVLTVGIGVQRNPEAGAARLAKGCELRFGDACWQLGLAYGYGRGVPRDIARAVDNLQKACDLESARGCSSLAHLHAIGSGVPEDLSRASELYRKACDERDASACTAVQLINEAPAAIAAEKDPAGNCGDVVKVLRPYVTMVATAVTRTSKPAYDALSKCAWRSGHWDSLRIAGEREAERHTGDAAALPYALYKLGKYAEAGEAIRREESVYRDSARLAWIRGALQNHDAQFAASIESETTALRLLDAKNQRAEGPTGRDALAMRARSLVCLGRFDEAERDIESMKALPNADAAVQALTELVFRARRDRIVVARTVQNPVPLGTYHLFGGKNAPGGSLVHVEIVNLDPKPRQFRVEVGIDGVTERSVVQVDAATGARKPLYFSPALSPGFNIDSIRAPEKAQLAVRIIEIDNGAEKVLRESVGPITLEPRDYLPVGKRLEENAFETTPEFVAAWSRRIRLRSKRC